MKPEQTSVSIVLIGKFSPSDFLLERLRTAKVLGEVEMAATTYEALLAEQAVSLSLPWGKFSVVGERLSVESSQVPYIRCADLVLRLLREVSPNALVSKFGINMTCHFKFSDIWARDKFATKLVPMGGWGAFGKTVENSLSQKGDRHGGVMRVTMRQASPPDRSGGWLDVTIEPSALIASDQGVAIALNDHYEMSADDLARLRGSPRAIGEELLGLLEANFEKSIERSFTVCDDLTGETP